MHEKLKPLEAGCLAVMVNCGNTPENVGKVVKCIQRVDFSSKLGEDDLSEMAVWWEIDKEVTWNHPKGWYAPITIPAAPEVYLMRIDPDDDQFDEETDEEDLTSKA